MYEIAEWLPDFYAGRARPEWLTIARNVPGTSANAVELVKRIENYCSGQEYVAAATAARFADPRSPFLVAYALHTGIIRKPEIYLLFQLRDIAMRLLGKELSWRYGEADPANVILLYKMAIEELDRKGDKNGAMVAKNRLLKFTRHLESLKV